MNSEQTQRARWVNAGRNYVSGYNSNESIYNEFIHLLLVSAVSEYLTYFKQNDILTVLNKFNKFIK